MKKLGIVVIGRLKHSIRFRTKVFFHSY